MNEKQEDIQLREVTFLLQTITQCCLFVQFLYLLNYVWTKNKLFIQDTYYHVDRAMQLFNFGYIEEEEEEEKVQDLQEDDASRDTGKSVKEEVKYELKYLEEYRQLKKEFKYNWERYDNKQKKIEIIRDSKRKQIIDEISQINVDMVSKGLVYLDVVHVNGNDANADKINMEADIHTMRQQIAALEKKLSSQELEDEVKEEAHQQVLDEYLENLKNSFIIEKTPLGNVLMYYNHKKQSFEYYSDNTIPYRYLETVSRKYVKTYDCAYLYVDMDVEIKEAERKIKEAEWKKQQQEQEQKAKKDSLEIQHTKEDNKPKKDVFAKFKSYNKEAISGRVNTGAPPKNSIPNNSVPNKVTSVPVLLKENANRYTCEGKMCNFSFLKKPNRKVVDKKYALSFADFKKMRQENKT